MRRLLFKSLVHGPLTEAGAGSGRCRAWPSLQRRSAGRPGGGWAAPSPFARSTRDPATAANSRSMRWAMSSTTWSDSACASWPRRATPMCCSSPARSRRTCAKPSSAPTRQRPTRNGWWRSATARGTAVFSRAVMPASGGVCRAAGRSAHRRLPAVADGAAQRAAGAARLRGEGRVNAGLTRDPCLRVIFTKLTLRCCRKSSYSAVIVGTVANQRLLSSPQPGETQMANPFVHVELSSTDVGAAKKFYANCSTGSSKTSRWARTCRTP